jgi:hypothetical protein
MEATGQEHNERSPHLYTRLLLAKGFGFPLWYPEPSRHPPEYQRRGVDVGDVGILTYDGHFDFLFSIFDIFPRTFNGRAPPPLAFHEAGDVRKTKAYSKGGHVLSNVRRELEQSGTHER